MAKLIGYTSLEGKGGFTVHQQYYIQTDRPIVMDNTLHIYCSDGKHRMCRLNLLSNDEQFELCELADACYTRQNRFQLVTLDGWSADEWFCSMIDDRLKINQVQIISHNPNIEHFSKELYRKAIRYCIDKYSLDDVGYIVVFNKLIDQDKPGLLGTCQRNKTHGRYIIKVSTDNSNDYDALDTIFHEFRHAEQYQLGFLEGREWMGQDCSHVDYLDQPWEIDARETATKMLQSFIETL